MTTGLLSELTGKFVEITSVGGQTRFVDVGILRSFDAQWVCLEKEGAMFYFSIARIRLIKPA